MRWVAIATAVGLSISLVGPSVPTQAHTQFTFRGYAYDGSELYAVSLSRTFDPYFDCPELEKGPAGEIGCMKWLVSHIRRYNTFDDVVSMVFFLGEDNWVPPEVNAGHIGDYEGVTLDASVDFHLEGKQTGEYVTVTGHYEQFQIYLTTLPTSLLPV